MKKKTVWILIFVVLVLVIIFIPYFYDSHNNRFHREYYRIRPILWSIREYEKACGKLPTTEEGLIKLKSYIACPGYSPSERVIMSDFKDIEGNPYIYQSDGKSFKFIINGIDWGSNSDVKSK